MRDDSYTEEQIGLAQQLHAAGLSRAWQPGDRLIGGEPPVRVVRSVSVEGEPLVEVERGGRLQTVGVAHPRIWLPTIEDVVDLLGQLGYEGAVMYKGGKVVHKFRHTQLGGDYRIQSGDSARTTCYRVLLQVFEGQEPPPAQPTVGRTSARA